MLLFPHPGAISPMRAISTRTVLTSCAYLFEYSRRVFFICVGLFSHFQVFFLQPEPDLDIYDLLIHKNDSTSDTYEVFLT